MELMEDILEGRAASRTLGRRRTARLRPPASALMKKPKSRKRGHSARVRIRINLKKQRTAMRKRFRALRRAFKLKDRRLTRDIKSLVCRRQVGAQDDI